MNYKTISTLLLCIISAASSMQMQRKPVKSTLGSNIRRQHKNPYEYLIDPADPSSIRSKLTSESETIKKELAADMKIKLTEALDYEIFELAARIISRRETRFSAEDSNFIRSRLLSHLDHFWGPLLQNPTFNADEYMPELMAYVLKNGTARNFQEAISSGHIKFACKLLQDPGFKVDRAKIWSMIDEMEDFGTAKILAKVFWEGREISDRDVFHILTFSVKTDWKEMIDGLKTHPNFEDEYYSVQNIRRALNYKNLRVVNDILQSGRLDSKVLFRLVATHGSAELLRLVLQIPEIDPTAYDNLLIKAVLQQYKSTERERDYAEIIAILMDFDGIRFQVELHSKLVHHLCSVPCSAAVKNHIWEWVYKNLDVPEYCTAACILLRDPQVEIDSSEVWSRIEAMSSNTCTERLAIALWENREIVKNYSVVYVSVRKDFRELIKSLKGRPNFDSQYYSVSTFAYAIKFMNFGVVEDIIASGRIPPETPYNFFSMNRSNYLLRIILSQPNADPTAFDNTLINSALEAFQKGWTDYGSENVKNIALLLDYPEVQSQVKLDVSLADSLCLVGTSASVKQIVWHWVLDNLDDTKLLAKFENHRKDHPSSPDSQMSMEDLDTIEESLKLQGARFVIKLVQRKIYARRLLQSRIMDMRPESIGMALDLYDLLEVGFLGD